MFHPAQHFFFIKLNLYNLTSLRSCLFLWLLLVGFTISAAQKGLNPLKKPPPVTLTRSEAGFEITLLVYKERKLLALKIDALENKSELKLPMARRLELWKPLIEQAFGDLDPKSSYLLSVGQYPELTTRIPLAALKSGRWNLETGKPHSGQAPSGVKDLLQRQKLFPELETFFKNFQYAVSVHSVEDVMLCSWKEIEALKPDLATVKTPPSESRLPCGASILFRINPIRGKD